VAMYAACSAAEKAARPEALRDIGRILNARSWSRSVQPSAIIQRVFFWTFGERHWTTHCLQRSVLASFVFLVAFLFALITLHGPPLDPPPEERADFSTGISGLILPLLLPDYLSLAKSRFLIGRMAISCGFVCVLVIVVLDILLCIIISIGCLAVFTVLTEGAFGITLVRAEWFYWREMFVESGTSIEMPVYPIFATSTLLTSAWAILVLLSTTVLKALMPVQRFTAWYFDVENHPVQAIGIVAGALVMIASLIWSVVRALI
jgi:hypothetical protein